MFPEIRKIVTQSSSNTITKSRYWENITKTFSEEYLESSIDYLF